ncbi:AraC family transcriptional regulator [Achromobacter insuavis]|uniref:AraC family transcriptional regulator n=1 Tax=Achromobacter insuavis TaxID=1287735 RepID=UPI0029DCDA0A|nr:helix-turn-helix domain-containing protein [Achromobacter sp.]MCG2604049.1 helix-turn-helix domain-containing protein [Achromobacter sp.]
MASGPTPDSAAPAVAGMTGSYHEALPVASLRPHFLCAWRSELAPGQAADVAVLPDGCADILWTGGRLSVVGPDVVAARPQLAPGARVLGLRFQPGAARGWLGVPLSELVGRRVELAALWGDARADRVARRVREAATPEGQMLALQEALTGDARRHEAPAPRAAALFRWLAAEPRPGGPGLDDRLEMSERSLRRFSHEHFGYGPKMLERILRLQRFIALLRGPAGLPLARLAADAGYADQAHLSREVRALCGMTPSALREQARG